MLHDVYLALGTNIGDRLSNLRAALRSLPPDAEPVAASKIYETPPWGYADQPAFLNMAVQVRTRLEPESLLRKLKTLEAELGRQHTFRWGPRLIDLDILFYDNLIINTPPLVIPHPRLHERAFVLIPLAGIAPDFIHPALNRTVSDLLTDSDTSGIVLFDEQLETTVTPNS